MEQRGPGARLGPYRLVQQIGEGGMGVVHLALDPTDRAVAVKVLRPHIAGDPSARERLRREVAVLQRVRHRLVAEVLDADPDGPQPYVVTQFVPGRSLEEHVREEGPLAPAALARLADGLGQALAAVHDAGVVHRDLKPANVLMLDGDPVVIDFGIAKVADDPRLTSADLVMGTPGYLAPELVEGAEVGPAADWWGWAATTAFAATGRPPFGRGPWPVVLDRVRRGAADLEGVPAPLVPVLTAALSTDVDARPREGWLRRAVQDLAASARAGAPDRAGASVGDAAATSALARMAGTGLDDDMAAAPAAPAGVEGAPAPDEHEATPAGGARDAPRGDDAATTVVPAVGRVDDADDQLDDGAPDDGEPDDDDLDDGLDDREGGRWSADEQATSALPPAASSRDRSAREGHDEPTSALHVGATSALPRREEPSGLRWEQPSGLRGDGPWGDPYVARSAESYAQPVAEHPAPHHLDQRAATVPQRHVPQDPWGAGGSQPAEWHLGRGGAGDWPPGPGASAPHGAAPAVVPRRPDRPGLRAAWAAALVGTTALAPVVGVLVGLVVVVLARTVERSHRWVLRRRELLGPRRGDVPLAVLRSPLPLLAGLVTGVLSLLLPLAVAAAVVFLTGVLLADASVVPGDPVSLAAGGAAGVVTAWWGPGGARLRRGSVVVSRAAPRGVVGTVLVVAGLLVVLAAVWLAVSGTAPDWSPLPSPPLDL
ncbi:serine/threonine-protein kinase [uncultured Pseudokineococcus sp.]|uniref:serine/threonine-protein kinase n=1 Tax=uncultured Pseudokineococcus sp. TaxID=1642928 RepID=UPI00260C6AA4|nr:serine/threonine-protein kinase [uncultured Pseudokineococcus sp.]